MVKIAGRKGYVDTASTVTGINQWSLDYTVDMLETTDFSASGVAAYLPGVSRWSGSFSGYKDGVPQTLGTVNSITLKLGESPTTFWTGAAYISGVHATNNHDGIVSYSYDFQGTAGLTSATA
jgi:hypothetical protein